MKLIPMFLIIILLASCPASPEAGTFTVATYNAYAFFDGIDDGDEYDGFSHSDGYDGAAYEERVRSLAILLGLELSSSDVIILEEVESIEVLADLIDSGLGDLGYRWYGLADDGSSPLSVGFLSRLQPVSATMHEAEGLRPILGLSFRVHGETVRVYGVHFRSRLSGGEDERWEQAMHLRTLMESGEGGIVIAAGDFNTDPRFPERSMAMFPEDAGGNHAMLVTPDPSKASEGIYFSPLISPDAPLEKEGTFCHDGSWYIYDGFLLSREAWDGSGLEYESVRIISDRRMEDRLGRPMPYDASTGYGYSDHFPAELTLRII